MLPTLKLFSCNTNCLIASSSYDRKLQLPISDYSIMFENDSIHAFQRSLPKRSKQPKMVSPNKAQSQTKDDFIMDTNNSSIVSKRSVEKLYWSGEPEYFRYFVNKFKRRSPLINRGYWLRMKAVETTVERFLTEDTGKKKVVVNLGCGL